VPVVSAYKRAKDSVITVRCHTRSLSQIRQSKATAGYRWFAAPLAKKETLALTANAPEEPKAAKEPKNIEFYGILQKTGNPLFV
jgi:hypothetical protein